MSAKTKIIVLHSKEIIYTCLFALLGVLFIFLMISMFRPKAAETGSNGVITEENRICYVPGVYNTNLILKDQAVNIEVVVDNQLLLNDILDIKNRIRPTFVQGLHNDQIQIDYRLAQSDEIKKILSKREVFDNIMDSNPAFKRMVSIFNLALT